MLHDWREFRDNLPVGYLIEFGARDQQFDQMDPAMLNIDELGIKRKTIAHAIARKIVLSVLEKIEEQLASYAAAFHPTTGDWRLATGDCFTH